MFFYLLENYRVTLFHVVEKEEGVLKYLVVKGELIVYLNSNLVNQRLEEES